MSAERTVTLRLHAPWDIVRGLGGIYGPYTGTCFGSTRQTDIEHMVATSDAIRLDAHELEALLLMEAANGLTLASDPTESALSRPAAAAAE